MSFQPSSVSSRVCSSCQILSSGQQREVLVGRDLQVQPRDLRRAHAVEREAALVIRVDQFLMRRRRLGEDAEPRERINALEQARARLRHRLPADAVESVASGDDVAGNLGGLAVVRKAQARRLGRDVVQRDAAHVEQDLPVGLDPRADQVLHHFLLAVDDDGAAGESGEIDAVTAAAEAQLDSMVREAFALQALADAGFDQKIDGALLQHAGAHTVLDVFAVATLDHDRVDAREMQQMRQQQAGRPRADNAYLAL